MYTWEIFVIHASVFVHNKTLKFQNNSTGGAMKLKSMAQKVGHDIKKSYCDWALKIMGVLKTPFVVSYDNFSFFGHTQKSN
jgi:hypothetical protein